MSKRTSEKRFNPYRPEQLRLLRGLRRMLRQREHYVEDTVSGMLYYTKTRRNHRQQH